MALLSEKAPATLRFSTGVGLLEKESFSGFEQPKDFCAVWRRAFENEISVIVPAEHDKSVWSLFADFF